MKWDQVWAGKQHGVNGLQLNSQQSFLFNKLHFGIISDLQENCRDCRGIGSLHPSSSQCCYNLVHLSKLRN